MNTAASLDLDDYCTALDWDNVEGSTFFLGLDLDWRSIRFKHLRTFSESANRRPALIHVEAGADHYSSLVEFIAAQFVARNYPVAAYRSQDTWPLLPNVDSVTPTTDEWPLDDELRHMTRSLNRSNTERRGLVVTRSLSPRQFDDLEFGIDHPGILWVVIGDEPLMRPSLTLSPRSSRPGQLYRFHRPDDSAFLLEPEFSTGLLTGPATID